MFKVIDGKLIVPHGSRWYRLLSEQPIPPAYGISPAMQALPDLKAFNALPADQRAEAIKGLMDEIED